MYENLGKCVESHFKDRKEALTPPLLEIKNILKDYDVIPDDAEMAEE